MKRTWWYPAEVPLVLASGSPRRRSILEMIDIPFVQVPPNIDENGFRDSPGDVVLHWARMKAKKISPSWKDHPVLGADTMVAIENELLGKPGNPDQATDMLRKLSGRWHTVYGGISIIWPEKGIDIEFVETTRVLFRELSGEEIEAYVSTGEPMDKAGAYGIQGYGCVLVERVDGCYFNVMGLPAARLVNELRNRLLNGE